jgi:hypothetical protein
MSDENLTENLSEAVEAEATTEKRGIAELKELLVFAISMGESLDMALSDGKLGIEDLGLLITPFTKAPDALDGLSDIADEIKDLDVAEMAQIKELINNELDLQDDNLEAKIEAGVKFLGAVHALVVAMR